LFGVVISMIVFSVWNICLIKHRRADAKF
jgi:hypothetical protein